MSSWDVYFQLSARNILTGHREIGEILLVVSFVEVVIVEYCVLDARNRQIEGLLIGLSS